MNQIVHWVGIDVSKAQLDGHIRPTAAAFQVPNTEVGIATLVQRLQQLQPVLSQFLKDQLQIVLGEWISSPQWTQSPLGASPLTAPAATTAIRPGFSATAIASPT